VATGAWEKFWVDGYGAWAPPIPIAASDAPTIGAGGVAVIAKALAQQLFPDAILTQTNISGAVTDIDDDPDSPDANWMTGSGAVTLRVSFPAPTSDLVAGFTQEFRIRVRPGT